MSSKPMQADPLQHLIAVAWNYPWSAHTGSGVGSPASRQRSQSFPDILGAAANWHRFAAKCEQK
jgi:hypothetical protein